MLSNYQFWLFTSVKECGDVMGIFVGHDHDNDYAVAYKEVLLAYGRYTGGKLFIMICLLMELVSLFCMKVNVGLILIFA